MNIKILYNIKAIEACVVMRISLYIQNSPVALVIFFLRNMYKNKHQGHRQQYIDIE